MSRDAPTQPSLKRSAILGGKPPEPDASGELPGGISIVRKGQRQVEIELLPGRQYTLGRHDAADISFVEDEVSRLHGFIRREDSSCIYEDYGSSNGSYLYVGDDPEPLLLPAHQSQPVFCGDVVELGCAAARIEFLAEAAPASEERFTTCVSTASRAFVHKIQIAARTRVPLFLHGPSGSGKTHWAREVHRQSSAEGAFVPINCARLPQDPSALHSELLGHVRGAFTGAESDRVGRLPLAKGGTLFLDEVESLSPLAQGFLLDVLEGTGDAAPLGSRQSLIEPPMFRLISASKVLLGASDLRDDLCERLAEGHMWQVPTLDERREDIPGLLRQFASQQSSLLGLELEVPDDAVAVALEAAWPGQIRQLKATLVVVAQIAMARLDPKGIGPNKVVLRRSDFIDHLRDRERAFSLHPQSRDFSLPLATAAPPDRAIARATAGTALERKVNPRSLTADQLEVLLRECRGNQSELARRLGVSRNTIARKAQMFGLS